MAARQGKTLALVRTTAVGFLEEVKAGTSARLKKDELYAQQAIVVFAYWAAKLNHPAAELDEKREKRIISRLRETRGNWGLLCYAVDGALRDDFIMGRSTRGDRCDRVSTIFRDLEQVERLAEKCKRFLAGEEHPLVVKYRHTNGNGHAESTG